MPGTVRISLTRSRPNGGCDRLKRVLVNAWYSGGDGEMTEVMEKPSASFLMTTSDLLSTLMPMSELGHSQPSLPAPAHPVVRYALNIDQRIAAPRLVANGMDRPRSRPRWL
jgi:hypothetical protein